jgi:hypothetical protein
MAPSASTPYVPPLGARFSQLYLERGTPQDDSVKLRRRIGSFFKNEMSDYGREAGKEIESGIGTDHHFSGYSSQVTDYLVRCSANDFRDAITVIHTAISRVYASERYTSHERSMRRWREFCSAAFIEENVAYRVDAKCIVHPFVDEEFSQAVSSLIRGLQDPRLGAVRAEVVTSIDALGGRSADHKAAIRAAFEAVEIYTKLTVTTCTVQRLNRNIVSEHLVRTIVARPEYRGPAGKAVTHFGESMVNWIDACHVYRHGQQVNEPSPPPPDLAVALVSAGLGHLRWLLDAAPLPEVRP